MSNTHWSARGHRPPKPGELWPPIQALLDADDDRPRSKQMEAGVSCLGGCSRAAYHYIRGDATCNEEQVRLPAIWGTLMHERLAVVYGTYPGRHRYSETPLTVPQIEIPGTADLVDYGTVTDYKTTTLKSIAYLKEHGPSKQQRWQVQTYGFAYNQAVKDDPDSDLTVGMVRLIYIPRDGTEHDVWYWEEPYDEAVALEALAWYEEIEARAGAEDAPEPEKDASYCRKYCRFFGELCQGKPKVKPKDEEKQADPFVEAAARQYFDAVAAENDAKARKAAARAQLEELGAVGRYSDYRVSWVNRAGSDVIDTEELIAQARALGLRSIPMKTTKGSTYPAVREVIE